MVKPSLPDIRVGQAWQLADGRNVTVQTIEGNQISGAQKPMLYPGSRGASPAGSVVVYVGSRSDFDGAVLLAPRWQVVADVVDDGFPEAISGLVAGVATIEHRSNFTVDPENPEKNPTPPRYTFSLAAADEDAAADVVRSALGERLLALRSATSL